MTTPAFHFSILQQFVESFESNGKILIDKLQKEIGNESTDVYPFINLYAFDVICREYIWELNGNNMYFEVDTPKFK